MKPLRLEREQGFHVPERPVWLGYNEQGIYDKIMQGTYMVKGSVISLIAPFNMGNKKMV